VMMTTYFTGEVPFRHVYINAIVRDEHGQKMSKSKDNILDPLDLIDGIEADALAAKRASNMIDTRQAESIVNRTKKQFPSGIPSFGADALRFTFASLATYGRTLNFDLNRCDGYRNFCNKLWNATRFVLMNVDGKDCGIDPASQRALSFVDRWLVGRLQYAKDEIAEHLAVYRFDLAAKALYEFVWDEYCDWYLECAKVQLARADAKNDAAAARGTRTVLVRELEETLRLAHPFIPFITEELWQSVAPLAGIAGETISLQSFPKANFDIVDAAAEREMTVLKEVVGACRALRSEMGLGPAQRVPLLVAGEAALLERFVPYLATLAKVSDVDIVDELPSSEAPVRVVGDTSLMLHIEVDVAAERERIAKDVARVEGEIAKAKATLDNERFVARAPKHVVDEHRTRLATFVTQLEQLKTQLSRLSS